MKNKIVLRNWGKVALLIILVIVTVVIIANLINNSSESFDKYADMCDQETGSICSYYEVRNYMIKK